MKIISLNLWGGRLFDDLIKFINNHQASTDIFCFQEILKNDSNLKVEKEYRANLLDELIELLPDFNYEFFAGVKNYNFAAEKVNYDLYEGKGIFVKKKLKIKSYKAKVLLGKRFPNLKSDYTNSPVTMQSIEVEINYENYFINNIHGLPMPGDKLDTRKRIKQSLEVLKILNTQKGKKILMGDFNLMPSTESVRMIEESGLVNLITKYKIKNTRGRGNPYYGTPEEQGFADYTFISPDITIKSFEVPDILISDHLPMILNVSIHAK